MLEPRSAGTALLCLILAVSPSACSTSTPYEEEFASALARWHRTGLTKYRFKSTQSCFCTVDYTAAMTVTVRSGLVVSVVDRATGASRPLEFRQPIDSVFAMVRQELIARPSRLEVEYDPALGYPRRLKYGTPENDAGGFIYLDSVVVAP